MTVRLDLQTIVIRNFAALLARARELGPKKVAVVAADDEVALTAADSSLAMGIAVPVLIGDAERIRAKAQSLGLADLASKGEFVASQTPSTTAAQLAGQGKVDIPAILGMMEGRKTAGLVMVELDSPPPQPVPAIETARIAKAYLEKQGVAFRE